MFGTKNWNSCADYACDIFPSSVVGAKSFINLDSYVSKSCTAIKICASPTFASFERVAPQAFDSGEADESTPSKNTCSFCASGMLLVAFDATDLLSGSGSGAIGSGDLATTGEGGVTATGDCPAALHPHNRYPTQFGCCWSTDTSMDRTDTCTTVPMCKRSDTPQNLKGSLTKSRKSAYYDYHYG